MQFPFEIGPWIVVIPPLIALVILQLAPGSQPNSGGSAALQQAPEEPEKRRRPGWLARWRARRGVRHGWSRWTLGYANGLRSTSLRLAELRHHTLVCGATGSGKTSALELMIDAFAEQLPMVIVDCKASDGLREHVSALPNALVWTIGGSVRWDPLRGDATSVANRLIQGEWYSREADVYRAAAERYLLWPCTG